MKPITLANLKRELDPKDRIEPGPAIFDRIVGGFSDPCVARVTFGEDVIRMYVTQAGSFKVGSAQPPMNREALAASARAFKLVAKLGLTDH